MFGRACTRVRSLPTQQRINKTCNNPSAIASRDVPSTFGSCFVSSHPPPSRWARHNCRVDVVP